MILVCGWCRRYLGLKEPLDRVVVTHGICPTCAARQRWTDVPTLVVSRARKDLLPIVEDLLQGVPRIQIMVDKRRTDRRRRSLRLTQAPDRRAGAERRRGAALLLG